VRGALAISALLATGLGAGAHAQPLEWGSCDFQDGDGRAECAEVEVPLYRDPSVGTIGIAVKRLPTDGARRGQIWFVDGGPGDSGLASFEHLGFLEEVSTGLDVYAFDHRGVGGSMRLSCPEEESPDSAGGREILDEEWDSCIDHLRTAYPFELGAMTVTAAAEDLTDLIATTAAPEDEVYLMGVSYGTYLVNRYLQVAPSQADGVILDGIAPGNWGFDEFDAGMDQTARRLLERCADHAACAAHLGPDPVATTEALYLALAEGHCGRLGLDADLLRLLLGVFLMVEDLRVYAPVVIHRLEQCRPRDVRAFVHLFDTLFPEDEEGVATESASHSPALQSHIALSEMWAGDAPDAEALETQLQGLLMSTGVSAAFAGRREGWPRYPLDRHAGQFAHSEVPMLMLHGDLDPTVPVERARDVESAYDGPAQTFVVFPDAGHVVVNEGGCAYDLYEAFLDLPTAEIDTACLQDRGAIDFDGDPELNEEVWGTTDLWGDEGCAGCANTDGKGAWAPLLLLLAFGVRVRGRYSGAEFAAAQSPYQR
jgi:pimeloyl-ACP methyl ester carboxylesterase